ncbi:ABC transporter ATP-binding protein [Streptomyces sp. Rer75]|uniref:ABC transporter ATP-binding protein n=1 Tax=Streptomyces sp. Rer75 TaxID=2750011 RepID=UPI0015D0C510|nr:ABC transporter ATP-binding protein [Streptomyces sp. Rer75]QLH26346.1 ABC transporter ATP-binding protein [Streptomyces sp. Rer75]
MPEPLLAVRDLHVTLRDGGHAIPAVRGLSFEVHQGEVVALVGESGAGKSLTARAVLGMPPHGAGVTGSVRLRGHELMGASYAGVRGRRMAFVPQDALTVLSPVHTIGDQITAAVRSVAKTSRQEARTRAVAALDRVGIADAARRARAYPHEFSGGMRQRAVIAMAMVNEPELVIADEPTTALDPAIEAQVLEALAAAREATGAALVLITHDLRIVARHADRVVVMYAGRAVESGPVEPVFRAPRAPYTAGLIASLPPAEVDVADRWLPSIAGAPPSPTDLPRGCAFAPRCPLARQDCADQEPALAAAGEPGQLAACHRSTDLPVPATGLFSRKATA